MNKAEELCHSSGPLKKHKYFEKKAKNDELEHSSGPWKKHKYISKVGEGAKAVYKYARKNVTGNYYKDRYLQKDEDALEDLEKMDEGNKTGDRDWNYRMDSRGYQKYAHDEKSRDAAEKNYYTKSLFGKIESKRHGGRTDMLDSLQLKTQKAAKEKRIKDIKDSVSRGQEKINKLFKSETKVTVKDTFTGKTRTPSKPKNAADTINIKQASEKNKKKK